MHRHPHPARRDPRAGQAILETGIAMVLLCLIVFGGVQVARLFAARDIVAYSASAGARAAAVGFNDFMVYKVTRVAAIPNAGQMTNPAQPADAPDTVWGDISAGEAITVGLLSRPGFPPEREVEQSRIPLYLGSTHWGELPAILDYEDWETVRYPMVIEDGEGAIGTRIRQEFPIDMPMHRAFILSDEIDLNHTAWLGDHHSLYLE
ncbi:MAG: TadE family protein [Kiritimatiellia bacterium]